MSGNQVLEMLQSYDNGNSIRIELNTKRMLLVNKNVINKIALMKLIPQCISISTISK